MKKLFLILLTFYLSYNTLSAQGLTLGFKTGMTLSQIKGPSEQDASGANLESNANAGGFMVGAIFRYKITDLAGIKWELLYNQKGTKYNFSGIGEQILPTSTRGRINLEGMQRIDLDVSNAYINIPIMGFSRLGKFELEGGVSIGFLVASTGSGELEITGAPPSGIPAGTYNAFLDYKYKRDNPGEINFIEADLVPINIDGQSINVPKILNAYYLFNEDRGNYFKTIDLGLVGGINYYWNKTLHLGVRVNYGLSDVTANDGYDISKVNLNNGDFEYRTDKDRNFSIQISLGFGF